jgi:peptide chain release factor subunit 1
MLPIEETLSRIEGFDPAGAKALSLYVDLDPSRAPGRELRAQLANVLRPLEEAAAQDPVAAAAFRADAEAARRAARSLRPPPRGAAIFSCGERGFLAVVPLAVRVTPEAHWSERFSLTSLLAAVDEHEKVLVVLADKETARFFRVFLGEIEEIGDVSDDIPGHHKQGGYSQRKYQRDHVKHVRWHARRVADELLRLQRRERVDRIFVGGPVEAVTELTGLLPGRLRERVRPLGGLPQVASHSDVLRAVEEANRSVERSYEETLVAQAVEAMGRQAAVAGVADVTAGVVGGQVYLLVYARGTTLAGTHCSSCGRLAAGELDGTCPVCGDSAERVDDLLDRLVSLTISRGGRVEEVRGTAAEELEPMGGIIALLRYRVTEPTAAR